MNSQAQAILNGAIAQLQALAVSQQGAIDADNADIADLQTKLAADQADVQTQTADLASTSSVVASLQQLVAGQ
jgi:hypothetical protein